jgi:hypothetical protein
MSKPKGLASYSQNELNCYYGKGNGTNTEWLMGYKTVSNSTKLPIYLECDSLSIIRGVAKVSLQNELDNMDTTIGGLDVAVSNNEALIISEAATARANETANASAITTEQTARYRQLLTA